MNNKKVINNEIGITFSTVNGSGSATANNTLLRAIYKMGIPVSGRNIFPSNIQGMPTWYSIRVSDAGYLGRREKEDILVSFNKNVIQKDITKIRDGGYLIVDSVIDLPDELPNINIIQIPVDDILENCDTPPNLKIYLANMVYVGVIAQLINIDKELISESLNQHFNNNKHATEPNLKVINKAFIWAGSIKIPKNLLLIPPENKKNNILVDGNTAAALGALYGGMQFAAWYPITPATSIAETLNEYIPKIRFDAETRSTTSVVVQAEDELASIGMVVGAGWAGLRSMTATSGPGLCLMSEFLGLAYFAEVPVVVWDVQRVGPSTGLPTRSSQGDLAFAHSISHGDADFIILLPANVKECFEFGWKALDLAEEFQTPVLVLSDLELGMNEWMSEEFEYPDADIKRGKVLWEKDLEVFISKNKEWGRYLDIDGDGIPYRTLPGNTHPKASYFARGTGHDEFAHYSEDPKTWEKNLCRLKKKFENAKHSVPQPIQNLEEKNKIGLISYGSSDMAVREVIDLLNEAGVPVDYLRIRALPANDKTTQFLSCHEKTFVVESNRDGQMKNILAMQFPGYAEKLVPISHLDGLSLTADWILKKIKNHLEGYVDDK